MGARPGWNLQTLSQSLISERRLIQRTPAGPVAPFQIDPLLNYQSSDIEAIPLRLTLKAIQNGTGKAVYVDTPGPLIVTPATIPGFSAGFSSSDPVYSSPNALMGQPSYAIVKWGVGSSPRNQLLCDWPHRGASVELVASNVEVYTVVGANPGPLGEQPAYAAELGPSQGMGYNEEPLTYSQRAFTLPAQRVAAVPEFARSVILSIDDTLAAGDFLSGFWEDSTGSPVLGVGRLREFPVEVFVPGSASQLALFLGGALLSLTVDLQWRIAP